MLRLERRRWSAVAWGGAAFLAFLNCGAAAGAAEKNTYQVSGFVGSFSTGVQISVPPYHGIEPRLALTYSSEGRNGPLGVGWSLSGFSQLLGRGELFIHPGAGWPLVASLDGQEVFVCPPASSYPSCASGGTHYTRAESYLKIVKSDEDHWTVFGKDGGRGPMGVGISKTKAGTGGDGSNSRTS